MELFFEKKFFELDEFCQKVIKEISDWRYFDITFQEMNFNLGLDDFEKSKKEKKSIKHLVEKDNYQPIFDFLKDKMGRIYVYEPNYNSIPATLIDYGFTLKSNTVQTDSHTWYERLGYDFQVFSTFEDFVKRADDL